MKALYYNATQAARLIGCDPRTLIAMIKHREIPGALKLRKTYRIPKSWVHRNTGEREAS
jgi:excisionase family DNA binding protein